MNASIRAARDHSSQSGRDALAAPARLAECVRKALDEYFGHLDGEIAGDIYSLVMAEVERPLLACVLEHCSGNQTRAAQVLGLNRTTLRKKLREHRLI